VFRGQTVVEQAVRGQMRLVRDAFYVAIVLLRSQDDGKLMMI